VRKVLAIASGGGHWVELARLLPSWDGCHVTYVTTSEEYRQLMADIARDRGNPAPRYHVILEANRWRKSRLAVQLAKIVWIMLKTRPDVVISTGAAPGYFALRMGKLLGARTIWVDSVANADEMSLSGIRARPYASLWLTQWPELAQPDGPYYRGSVL